MIIDDFYKIKKIKNSVVFHAEINLKTNERKKETNDVCLGSRWRSRQ